MFEVAESRWRRGEVTLGNREREHAKTWGEGALGPRIQTTYIYM